MTDRPGPAALAWDASSGGIDWHLELDRALLLPAQLVNGRLRIRAGHGVEARGLVVALTAVEHWRHRETSTDGQGHTTTRVVTSRQDVIHEPVQIRGPLQLAAGETLDTAFELPVPPGGPATLDAEDAGLDWTVEAKLDIEGGFDSGIHASVVVAQPTALLRAGAVPVGEFALYKSADATADGLSGSIELKPMPLVVGERFAGKVTVHALAHTRIRGIRAEVRVHVEATVSSGENETVVLWSGMLDAAAAGEVDLAGDREYAIEGTLPGRALPSIQLPHGRTNATFHVILDRPWALDSHLVRDIAIATTAEV